MLAVIDYHKGNLQSVQQGLVEAGAEARITDDPQVIAQAAALVLPGVGSFTDAMESMNALGQTDAIRSCIQAGTPFLGICLGMQLLFEAGEEHAIGGTTPGLGLIPGTVSRMPEADESGRLYKIPHVGWNNVDQTTAGCALFEGIPTGEYFYFTHSFAAPHSNFTRATATHSETFPCAVQVGSHCYGVQFHPEKSSDAGQRLLRNFVRQALL